MERGEKSSDIADGEDLLRSGEVLVWPGKAMYVDNTDSIKPTLQCCLKDPRAKQMVADVFAGRVSPGGVDHVAERLLTEIMTPIHGDDPHSFRRMVWHLLQMFFDQSYWNRLWIIQEMLLAQGLGVLCGPSSLRRDQPGTWLNEEEIATAFLLGIGFEVAARNLWADYLSGEKQPPVLFGKNFVNDEVLAKATSASSAFARLGRSLFCFRHGTALNLEELILCHVRSTCSNPYDRIYGLLGMSKDVTRMNPFKVDYRSDIVDVMAETLLWCKSEDSLLLGDELVDVLGLRSSCDERPADVVQYGKWAEDFMSKWCSRELVTGFRKVSIRLEGPQSFGEGSLVRFFIRSWSFRTRRQMSLIYEDVEDSFVLAEIQNPADTFIIGRNSDIVTMHNDFLRDASTPYPDPSKDTCFVTHTKVCLMDITLSDLMRILAVETLYWMKGQLPQITS